MYELNISEPGKFLSAFLKHLLILLALFIKSPLLSVCDSLMQQRVNGSSDAWWCMLLCPQGASYDPGLLTQFFQQFSKESADSGSDLLVRLRLILYSCKIVYMIYFYLIYLGVECFILIICIILWFLVISSWYGCMAAVFNRRFDFFQNQVHMDVRRDAGHTHCALGRRHSFATGDHGDSLTST